MISVPYPRIKNSKTIDLFPTIAPLLVPLTPELRKAYGVYRAKKGNPGVVLPLNTLTPGTVSPAQEDALSALYRTTYVKLKEDHRLLDWAYDLRNSSEIPYCPMCGNAGRNALDHYLAHAHYPEFTLLSFNLVPTCTACNSKRNKHANAPNSALPLLHPYFEGARLSSPLVMVRIVPDDLTANVPTFEMPSFQLVPSIHSTDPLFSRLENHIGKCVDNTQLVRWVKGRWTVWRTKARNYKTIGEFQKAIQVELNGEVDAGGENNWTAAFLRGLYGSTAVLQWLMLNPS